MLITHQHPLNRSLTVAVVGLANVGKSTLINTFLGEDLSIVSPKAQTTRNYFHCIAHIDRTELIFIDTPGVTTGQNELYRRMNGQVDFALDGVDLTLLLVDATSPNVMNTIERFWHQLDRKIESPVWIVFNKIDQLKVNEREKLAQNFVQLKEKNIYPCDKFFFLSAVEEENVHELTAALCDFAPSRPHLYPDGEVSNKNMRFFVAEYIREQALYLLKDEVPHDLAVLVDDFKEKENASHVSATILVNRPSQRAIVVGTQGRMIREISSRSRQKIAALVGQPVHLKLHVKLAPKWYNSPAILKDIGLLQGQRSLQVWRSK